MKKHILSLSLICLSFTIKNAQKADTNAKVEEFDVDGIKVILKHSPKEVISVNLFINGGTANYEKEQEGIENFALSLAITGGTANLDKNEQSNASNKIGTEISANTDYDYGQITLRCVKQFWNESWILYADAIMNPIFDEEQFQILKEQLVNGAKQTESDPDDQLRNLAMSNVFTGKNYSKIPAGTAESLAKLSLDDVKNYYTNLLGKKRVFVVITGDISKDDISAKIKSSLASLPEGTEPTVEEITAMESPSNVIEDRDIETNYIRGYMNAPKMDSKEGVSMMMAMRILRTRLFVEIRTKRGLSYAPSAAYATGIINSPYNFIYVSTTDPKQSMEVMVNEIDKLRSDGYSEKELIDIKQSYLTTHYMGLETMSSQSNNLGLAELKGNWEMAEDFANIVNDINLEDINNVMKKYAGTISWTYLGKEDMVNEKDFLQPKKLEDSIPIKN